VLSLLLAFGLASLDLCGVSVFVNCAGGVATAVAVAASDSPSSSTTTSSSTVLSDQSTPLSFPNSYIDLTLDDSSLSSGDNTLDCLAARLVLDPLSGLSDAGLDPVRGVAVPFAAAICMAFFPSSSMLPRFENCIFSGLVRSSKPPVGIDMVMPLKANAPAVDGRCVPLSVPAPVVTTPSVPFVLLFSAAVSEAEESCTTIAGRLDTRLSLFSEGSVTVEGAVVAGVPGCSALSRRISSFNSDLAKKDGGGGAVDSGDERFGP
jgi:hypothetical protein